MFTAIRNMLIVRRPIDDIVSGLTRMTKQLRASQEAHTTRVKWMESEVMTSRAKAARAGRILDKIDKLLD